MSSVYENMARVRSSLASDPHADRETERTHGHILDAYEDAIREHEEAIKGHEARLRGHRDALERSSKKRRRDDGVRERGGRFRFKSKGSSGSASGVEGRRHGKGRYGSEGRRAEGGDREEERAGRRHGRERRGRRSDEGRNERDEDDGDDRVDRYAAHPLPRPEEEGWLDPSLDSAGEAYDTEMPRRREKKSRRSRRGRSDTPNVPVTPDDEEPADPDAAFADSLFDALADDEGAAAYWEGVYSQPLNAYPRPKVRRDEDVGAKDDGEDPLEEMDDEEYVQYVKRKMWEKANPHLVREMEMREEKEREEREKKERRRRGQPSPAGGSGRGGLDDVDAALASGEERRARRMKDLKEKARWEGVWGAYIRAWKADGLGRNGAKDIPWAVEGRNFENVDADKVSAFLESVIRHVLPRPEGANEADGKLKVAMLKAERFRWHPDKIQHRFGGKETLREDVMEKVTGVFQIIDEMLEQERMRS